MIATLIERRVQRPACTAGKCLPHCPAVLSRPRFLFDQDKSRQTAVGFPTWRRSSVNVAKVLCRLKTSPKEEKCQPRL
jgi:hypothetical protein